MVQWLGLHAFTARARVQTLVGKLRFCKPHGTAKKKKRKKVSKVLQYHTGVRAKSLSHVRLFATPWTVARQVPLSMGILQARILEWVAISFPRDLPDPGIKPGSPALQADSLPSEPPGKPTCGVE